MAPYHQVKIKTTPHVPLLAPCSHCHPLTLHLPRNSLDPQEPFPGHYKVCPTDPIPLPAIPAISTCHPLTPWISCNPSGQCLVFLTYLVSELFPCQSLFSPVGSLCFPLASAPFPQSQTFSLISLSHKSLGLLSCFSLQHLVILLVFCLVNILFPLSSCHLPLVLDPSPQSPRVSLGPCA